MLLKVTVHYISGASHGAFHQTVGSVVEGLSWTTVSGSHYDLSLRH